MKKVFLLLLALCAIAGVSAQNANRKGFFIEAAVGGSVGNPPLSGLSMDKGVLNGHYTGGTVVNFAFGPRFRTGSHTAFDFRIEAQANTARITQSLVLKAMPGMRITTGELFGNISMYISANIGFAIADSGCADLYSDFIPNDGTEATWDLFSSDPSFGAGYSLGLGLNITTHFYGGFVWDAQYMIHQTRDNLTWTNLHYGMAGLRLGYRF